jgi:hypothetical protein
MQTDKTTRPQVADSRQPRHDAIQVSFRFFTWLLRLRLFRRSTVIWPTWAGSCCIVFVLFLFIAAWITCGESYLAETHRSEADILVVEGWIGQKGISAAVQEFKRGGYRYIVASGGLTSGFWGENEPESYAQMAAREMIRLGFPQEEIVVATSGNTEKHRTFASAVAVWRTLRDAGIKPKALNVFTFGAHARRSALVFAKVNADAAKIGVVAWVPPEYQHERWWHSSERAKQLLEETIGYIYEVLFNSGRPSNSPLESSKSEVEK